MNLSQKEPLTVEMNEGIKSCADCKITKTPLWRGGPSGPKSLCNACGIRHMKKKRRSAMVGVIKGKDKRREKISTAATTNSATTIGGGDSSGSSGGKNSSDGKSYKKGKLSEDLRVRLMALGKEVVVLQRRQRSPMKRQRSSKKLGEVEQAAVLLMALSCGSVFA